ncbi:hypothetical protein ACGF7U_15590 [Micromonospora sp. NPDC047670]|uniref:hypothetical protein n=1 Tax=Micromonospora sp. NPDC047670 TaxID=3364252 RepID=UPI00371C46AE
MLLVGGAIGAWSAHEAILGDAAHAVDEPRPGIVGALLGDTGAVADDVLAPASPPGPTADGGPAGLDVLREPLLLARGNAGVARPLRGERDPAVRVPRGGLPAAVAPVRRVVDRVAGAGVAEAGKAAEPVTRPVVGAVAPVTRPVVGAVVPAVRGIAGTGPLDTVDAVVRPVASPIVDTLAPVLGVTGPILGPPADPVVPPGEPVDPRPGPGEAVPVTTTPVTATAGATGRPVRASAAAPSHPQAAPPAPRRDVAAGRWSGGEPAAGAPADATRDHVGGTGAGELMPGPSGSATISASSGAPAADLSPRPWTPELASGRCASSRCGTFAERSPQPDTTPA